MNKAEEIIKKLGKKQGRTVELQDLDGKEICGLYHWRGELFCLKMGDDIPYETLSISEQEKIHLCVMNDMFKVNSTL